MGGTIPLMTLLMTPLMTPLMTLLMTLLATIQLGTIPLMTLLMTPLAMIQLMTIPLMMIAALMMNLSQSQRQPQEEGVLLKSTRTLKTLVAVPFQLLSVALPVLWHLGLVVTCGRQKQKQTRQPLTESGEVWSWNPSN